MRGSCRSPRRSRQIRPIASSLLTDGINVAAVTQLLDAVQNAAPSMQKCADVAESLPEMHVEQLKSVVDPAKEKLVTINATFQKAAALAPVAGPVLGANGNRTYLIVAQNSAELRSSGGFPGSMGTLEIRDGEIISQRLLESL